MKTSTDPKTAARTQRKTDCITPPDRRMLVRHQGVEVLRYLLLALVLCLGACTLPSADPQREAQADKVYEVVRRNDVAAFKAMATPALQAQDLAEPLLNLQGHVHPSAPVEVKTIGWSNNVSTGGASYRVIRRYTHPEGAVDTDILLVQSEDGAWGVDRFWAVRVSATAVRAAAEQVEAAQFTLTGKSAQHYLILAGAGLSAALCLVSAGVAGFRRRWGWMLMTLFGVGLFTLNWTTGAVAFQPIYVAILGAGFWKGAGPADPLLIMLALPIPAILFWSLGKWRKRVRKPKGSASSGPVAGTPDL